MIITYTMNNTLKNKLTLLKAKDYASRVEGVAEFNLSFMKYERLSILRQKVSEIIAFSFEQEGLEYAHPVNNDSLASDIVSMWQRERKCSLLFDGNVEISFDVKERQTFVKSIFNLNKNCDAMFIFKDRFIYISDDEYAVKVFDVFI